MSRLDLESALEPRLVDEWESLAHDTDAPPFLRPGWVAAWWSAFGKGRLVAGTLRSRDGALRALVPLVARGPALLSASNWHTPEVGVLARDDEARAELVRAALQDGPAVVSLRFVGADLAEQVREVGERAGRRVVVRPLEHSPVVVVTGSFEDYERALEPHLRAELCRRDRRLRERGVVDVVLDDGGVQVDERVAEVMRVEASGWKGRSGTAMADDPRVRAFYVHVGRWAAERGWLRTAVIRLDGVAIAADLALEHDAVQYLLKTGYDEELRALAPGKLLRHAVLRDVHDRGLARYEFLGDADAWKREWTAVTTTRFSVQAYDGLLGNLGWWVEDVGRSAVRRLRPERLERSA